MNENEEYIDDVVITDVDEQGPALQDIVKQHKSYISPKNNSNYEEEAQAILELTYAEHNAQTDREKIQVIESLQLKTPLELFYATDLMVKESDIGIGIYEVTYIQQKAKELANLRK